VVDLPSPGARLRAPPAAWSSTGASTPGRDPRPVAVTPTDTHNAAGGIVSPGVAWQIPVTSEPSTEGRAA